MIYVVKRRGGGSYAEQLGMSKKSFKACVCIDCTSMGAIRQSDKKHIDPKRVKKSEFPYEDFSPLFLGPVACSDGLVARTLENAWQYSKVYKMMADGRGNPRPEFFEWQREGFAEKNGVRYPMGPAAVPLYSYWKCGGKFCKLDYIEARKRIYIPEYAKLFAKTASFKNLMALKDQGKDIILVDFDGYNQRHSDFNLTYNEVIHYPVLPMGYAFIIAMMLEGLIQVDGDKVTYADGLMTPPEKPIRTEYELKMKVKQGFASIRGASKKVSRKNADMTLDLSARTDVTNPNFIRQVQAAVVPKPVSPETDLVKAITGPEFTEEQQAAKIKFDKIYRPFVYKVLLAKPEKDGLGFTYRQIFDSDNLRYKVPYRGDISGEVVYSEVWRRLFGVEGSKPALLSFDVTGGNVGSGAFRLYLRLLVKSVYLDLIRKDTMILKDVRGHTIYKRDPHTNKYILNKKGEKVPVRVPRTVSADDDALAKALPMVQTDNRSRQKERTIFQRHISLKYLAYLYVHDTKHSKSGWFYRASAEMFESGVPMSKVLDGCLERKEIKQRQSFDTALSRFRDAIDEKTKELSKAIFSAEDAKVMSESELLDREWKSSARKFGMSRVKDVRLRVMAAMMEAFEEGNLR